MDIYPAILIYWTCLIGLWFPVGTCGDPGRVNLTALYLNKVSLADLQHSRVGEFFEWIV